MNDSAAPVYRQSAVVPFRVNTDGGADVLLVTNNSGTRWIVPKGLVEPGMTPADSAAKEALEEAGIEGDVLPTVLGGYDYRKWGGVCRVEVYLMRVSREHDMWEEDGWRQRRWVAAELLADCLDDRVPRELVARVVAAVFDAVCVGG